MDFREILDEYRTMLMGRTRSLCYVRDFPAQLELEDIVGAAMIKALKEYSTFRGSTRGEFGAWLLVILDNTIIDLLRRSSADKRGPGRTKSFEDFLNESNSRLEFFLNAEMSSVGSRVRDAELIQKIYEKIELLPEDLRNALIMRYVAGKSLQEMSTLLDISERSVSERLRKGIERLRKLFPEG